MANIKIFYFFLYIRIFYFFTKYFFDNKDNKNPPFKTNKLLKINI